MKPLARALVALLSGALGVLSFAPFHAWPLAPLSLAALFAFWLADPRPRAAALIGFLWGLGLFGAGVSWIYVSLHVYGNMPAWLAAPATLLFCAYLALFPALAGAIGARWMRRAAGAPSTAIAALAMMPALFIATEMLRGWFLTGFPWLSIGYSQTPGGALPAPLTGYAPLGGVYAIGLVLAVSAGLFAWAANRLAWRRTARGVRLAAVAGVVALWVAGAVLGRIEWGEPAGAPVPVALLQGNVPQDIKWRAETFEMTLARYGDLARGAEGARLVVFPETALPGFLDLIPASYLDAARETARGRRQDWIVGVPIAEREPGVNAYRYFNSALSMGTAPPARYDKQHLVAFGEFIPPLFSWAYRWLDIPLAGFTPGATEPVPMDLGGLRVAVNICYEDAFGREIAPPAAAAHLMVNLSNMAWFGRSLAADQHAQFSQMRSLETSRWMLRATNTGLTAAIDEGGRIVAALPQFATGALAVRPVPRSGATPYSRWGDVAVFGLLALLLGAAALRRGARG